MPPVKMKGDGRMAKNPKKTLMRLLGYMKKYIPTLIVVLLCICITAFASTTGSAALGTLVDDYILPMVASGSTDFGPIAAFLVRIGCIFAVGIFAAWLHNFLMVGVSQGTQKTIRDEMFAKMQRLPIRYFDSNTAGNIMSRYTSDIDTLRQMVGQSIPQTASSIITLLVVSWRLLDTSWLLCLVMVVTVFCILQVTKFVVKKSGTYFIGQQ